MIENIFLSFIPIFVAVDALGVLPFFASLTVGMKKDQKTKVIIQSMVTALALAVGFIFLGKAVFKFLGITMGDFMIAGGAILFCLAIADMISPVKKRYMPASEVGAVPLGTPLIVGPAVLTTSMLTISQYGLWPTLISVLVNISLAGAIFGVSSTLMKILGDGGTKALSRIASLLLATIAVMLARKGLMEFLG